MNEENWVETTKMRKYRKWKDRKLKNRKKIAGSEMQEREKKNEKQQQEKKREMTRETEKIITLV